MKTTLGLGLALSERGILISADRCVERLYSGLVESFTDHLRPSEQLRRTVRPLVTDLLRSGAPCETRLIV